RYPPPALRRRARYGSSRRSRVGWIPEEARRACSCFAGVETNFATELKGVSTARPTQRVRKCLGWGAVDRWGRQPTAGASSRGASAAVGIAERRRKSSRRYGPP